MRENYCHIALTDVQEHEEQEERHTRDDVRIEHRDIVQERDRLLSAASHVMDADSGYRAQDGSENGSNQSDDQSVLDSTHQRACSLHVACKQVGIQFCRKARPVAQDLAFRKREDCYKDDRGIKHHEKQPYVTLCDKSFHG